MHERTQVKAAASGKSFRRQETWREHRQAAPKQVEQRAIPVKPKSAPKAHQRTARKKVEQALEAMKQVQALPPKEKDAPPVSETDPEARLLKPGHGGFD